MTASARSRQFSWSRVAALCHKETLQIVRDPSSVLIAFVLPAILLFIFGYGVNLDSSHTLVGLVREDGGPAAHDFAATLTATPSLDVREMNSRQEAELALLESRIRGYVVIPADFGQRVAARTLPAVFVGTDASEPNSAGFVARDIQGVWSRWQLQWLADQARQPPVQLAVEARSWFNPSAESRNFLIPGSIVIIMTILGALLTSLVVAREWERGTMEALLAARVTRSEILLSKLIPYYSLAVIAMATCMAIAIGIMGIPFRGSLPVLLLVTTLFLGGTLGMGLLISTVTRNQFNAAQTALNLAYMPAVMLSGFVYELSSMPAFVQAVSYVLPARYFMSALQTLFQSGVIWSALLPNIAFLAAATFVFIALTLKKTRETLE